LKRYFFIFLFFSCSSARVPLDKVLLSPTIFFDKLKVFYSNDLVSGSFKGKINVYKDSLVSFKFYGPLGIEVLSGRFDTTLILSGKFSDSIQVNFISKIQHVFGVRMNRNMIEYLFTFKYDNLFREIKSNVESNIEISNKVLHHGRYIIVMKDFNANSTSMITFVKDKFPLQIILEFKDKKDFFKVSFEIYSLHG